MKKSALALGIGLSVLLAACTEKARVHSLVDQFERRTADYEALKTMLLDEKQLIGEVRDDSCGGVSSSLIGRFWLSTSGLWIDDFSDEVRWPLEAVLENYAISLSRYNRYKELQARIQVSGLDYCKVDGSSWVRMTDVREGPLFGHCLAIFTSGAEAQSSGERPNHPVLGSRPLALGRGWYLDHSCGS